MLFAVHAFKVRKRGLYIAGFFEFSSSFWQYSQCCIYNSRRSFGVGSQEKTASQDDGAAGSGYGSLCNIFGAFDVDNNKVSAYCHIKYRRRLRHRRVYGFGGTAGACYESA